MFQTRYNPAASPTPPVAVTVALVDSPVRTVPLPSNRDHAEHMRTPLLRLTSSPGDTPTAQKRSDALGEAAELRFSDSVARYSHDNGGESSTLSRRATP